MIIIADFVSTKTPGTKVLEWPPTIHVIFILTASLVCKPGFFQVGSRCFHVNNTDKVTWAESLNRCKRIGGILATVDNEFLTSATLTHNLTLPGDLHIGLFTTENWEWQDGTSLNTGFWHPGYPQNITGWPTCAALSVQTSKVINTVCTSKLNFVCQTKQRKFIVMVSLTLYLSCLFLSSFF